MGHDCHGSCSSGSSSQSCCSHGSCSTDHSSVKGGCGCGCSSCHCSCHQQGKYADQLLHLADEAWMEILKEKIKEEIRLNAGEQMTQLAKLVSAANHARWKDKMQGKKDYEDFECQLKNTMCGAPKK